MPSASSMMRTFREGARRGLRGLDLVLDSLALLGLVVMVLIISWQVFARFVLDDSPRWASESALVLMGWLGFLGVAIGLREGSHIAVGFIVERLPRPARRAAAKLTPLLMLAFGGYLIVQGWDFTQLMARNTMPGTGLPRSVQYAAMPVAGVLVFLYALLQLLGVNLKGTGAVSTSEGERSGDIDGSAS